MKKSHENDLQKIGKSELAEVRSIYQALHEEIHTLWELYNIRIGAQVEELEKTDALLLYWPVSRDYFVVYDNNASRIDRIPDEYLRTLLVKTYTKAKGLLDSFRMNNLLLEKYESVNLIAIETPSDTKTQLAHKHHEGLVKYAQGIVQQHYEMKKLISDLSAHFAVATSR